MSDLIDKRFGPYQVLEQIGRGAMAAVFRARDTRDGRMVALKLVAPELAADPKFDQRFEREAKVLLKLRHPHIVPVEDHGEQGGYAYLVMPLLRVGTLTDRLDAGPLSPQEGARLIQQVSQALDFAHAQGVIHRDVKPSNILLDEQGNALLADFGLARLQEGGISLTGSMLVGTPAYMSPEQVRGEKATARSDQYSLGVILFQLTTGQLPFEGETPIAVALKHINETVPSARSASPNVPEAVERVILKATAQDPNDRFASVAAMSQAFQEALAHSLDPESSPAPTFELPAPVKATMELPSAELARSNAWRRRLTQAAGLIMALFLVLPAMAAGRILGIVPDPSTSLEATQLLLVKEGTIQAMSTELAGSRADLMQAEQVQTAVVATLLAGADQTENPPTASALPGATLEPTASSRPSLELTPLELATGSPPTPTATSGALPLPGPSPTSGAGVTPSPTVGSSSAPSPTPSASPTATASPTASPTPTATTSTCSLLNIGGFDTPGKEVHWDLGNQSSVNLALTHLHIDWPSSNSQLKKIRLDSSLIWNAGDGSPATDVGSGDLKGNPKLGSGSSHVLSFEFGSNAADSGYQLLVEFDYGCSLAADD